MAESFIPAIPRDSRPVTLDRPHFVGIGGQGMAPLARVLCSNGARVSGSDHRGGPALTVLASAGCTIYSGHAADHLGDPTCVVYSNAIDRRNPEIEAAFARGIPVIHRARALAELMSGGRHCVAVAGTHGKSSTSAMLATTLEALGSDPSYVIGADLTGPATGGHLGAGSLLVAEADESDRSFHLLKPDTAVVLNIEHDHPENYAGLMEHIDAYEAFARGIAADGLLIAGTDDVGVRVMVGKLSLARPDVRVVTYGIGPAVDWRVTALETDSAGSVVAVEAPSGEGFRIDLRVPGRHQALNAVAALVTAAHLDQVEPARFASALSSYQGIPRRCTVTRTPSGVTVVDSFAHHPTEMAEDLHVARSLGGEDSRVYAVFQPTGRARTETLGDAMGRVLATTDLGLVLTIRSQDTAVCQATRQIILNGGAIAGGAVQPADPDTAPVLLGRLVRPGDVVVVMGAGDVGDLVPIITTVVSQLPVLQAV